MRKLRSGTSPKERRRTRVRRNAVMSDAGLFDPGGAYRDAGLGRRAGDLERDDLRPGAGCHNRDDPRSCQPRRVAGRGTAAFVVVRLARDRPPHSRPRRTVTERLSAQDRLYPRRIARRTWLLFETFAGPDDNWLPPGNYQTKPHEEIAHRSSPTRRTAVAR